MNVFIEISANPNKIPDNKKNGKKLHRHAIKTTIRLVN